MKAILHYLKLYFLIVSQYIKIRSTYRTDFFVSFFGIILRDISGLFALWIIFKSIPTIAGWNYHQLIFLYGFSLLALAPLQMFFDHTWDLGRHVLEGTFLKYYLRPLNVLFYYMSEVFDIKAFGQIFFGVLSILYATYHLNFTWSFSRVIFLLVLLVSSSLVMVSITIMSISIIFWIHKSNSVTDILLRLRELARYPLSIFNNIFKFFFTFVIPIGFIAYYPVKLLLQTGQTDFYAYLSPISGFILFNLAIVVWKQGVRSYNGTGT